MKMKKGDLVRVLYGAHQGQGGRLARIFTARRQGIVEGVNLIKRKAPGGTGPKQEVAAPLDLSKLAVVCPKCGKISRLGYRFEGQVKVRFCKKCQAEVS